MQRPMWVVRPRGRQPTGDLLRRSNYIGVGIGRELGQLPTATSRAALTAQFRELHPTWRHGRHRGTAAQLWSFLHDIKTGDRVAHYDASASHYYLGTVRSEARYDISFPQDIAFRRDVDWSHRVDRARLPVDTRNALNILQTLFTLHHNQAAILEAASVPLDAPPDTVPEALRRASVSAPAAAPLRDPSDAPAQEASPAPTPTHVAPIEDLRAQLETLAAQVVEARLALLPNRAIKSLFAGALHAMGYRPHVSAAPHPSGCDVFIGGSGTPGRPATVFVTLFPHAHAEVNELAITELLKRVPLGQHLFVVSRGGFSSAAHKLRHERIGADLTLIDLIELRKTLLDHYDRMDLETRSLLPLRRIYWPAQ